MNLVEFRLIGRHGNPGPVKDDKTRAGGALVDGADEAALEEVVILAAVLLDDGAIPVVGLGGVDFCTRLQLIGGGDDAARHFSKVRSSSVTELLRTRRFDAESKHTTTMERRGEERRAVM